MAYGTVNADVISTSTSGGVLGAGNASIMKNRIINGAMIVNQRAFSGTPANSAYTLDRWQAQQSGGGTYTVTQSTSAPTGFINSLLVTVTSTDTSLGTSDYYIVNQNIEGLNITDLAWGTADAKTVTLSFWVRSSLTGTFGGSLMNEGYNRTYPFSYTISSANTWTQISITVAGDTTGTWLTTNGTGIRVEFGLGLGTNYVGTAGAWVASEKYTVTGAVSVIGTSGATWAITGVQLEVGSNATGFEYRQYTTEFALCQRYFQQYGDNLSNKCIMPYGSAAGSGELDAYMTMPVVMRTTPTLSSLNLTAYDGQNAPIALTGGTVYTATASVFGVYFGSSGLTTFRPYMVRTHSSDGYMRLSAEL